MRTPALVLLLVLWLSGCSWLTAREDPVGTASAQEARRAELALWTVKGRVQSDSQRASLRWRQRGETFDVVLRGPFGLGGLRIIGDAGQVEIIDGESSTITPLPEQEIFQRTGLYVPLQALPFWLRGVVAPGVPATITRGPLGHLQSIEQAGWRVDLAQYIAVDGLPFPHQLTLSAPGASLNLEVRDWLIDE